jgi:hypothetical protein
MIFFEATLSALTGLALLLVIGHPHLHRTALLSVVKDADGHQA